MLDEIDYSQYRGWLRQATLEDLISLAPRLREEDKDEILANSGAPPEMALPAFLSPTTFVCGVLESDTPEIVMGYQTVESAPNAALVWMLSSPVLFDYPQRFAPVSRAIIDKWHEHYEVLTNFVDARNTRHIKWLEWLGFKMLKRIEKFGAHSLPFYDFYSYREK